MQIDTVPYELPDARARQWRDALYILNGIAGEKGLTKATLTASVGLEMWELEVRLQRRLVQKILNPHSECPMIDLVGHQLSQRLSVIPLLFVGWSVCIGDRLVSEAISALGGVGN